MEILKKVKRKLKSLSLKKVKFSDLNKREKVYLYAGDVPPMKEYSEYIGLSLTQWNKNHIKHDVLKKYPLKDNTVDRYQSEDVFEHINYEQLHLVINEIYRILKKGGLFRLSLPDYTCDILNKRTQKNDKGELIFDPFGGGAFVNGKVINGGHLWFPTYFKVKKLLEKTDFKNYAFLHYYDESGKGTINKIDYSKGFIMRTPDNDDRVKNPYRPMSLVVDCFK
jgi:predicted SAM-dependent methyltransferase